MLRSRLNRSGSCRVVVRFLAVGACAASPSLAAAPARADSGPVIVIPSRPGVPVVINGRDASYAVVEGDWGLARPGARAGHRDRRSSAAAELGLSPSATPIIRAMAARRRAAATRSSPRPTARCPSRPRVFSRSLVDVVRSRSQPTTHRRSAATQRSPQSARDSEHAAGHHQRSVNRHNPPPIVVAHVEAADHRPIARAATAG